MASILKDYVHCPVCYELMQGANHEPYALQCLHTLCHNCLDTITQNATSPQRNLPPKFLKCPQCQTVCDRVAIKKDFRTKSLVEDYVKDKSKHSQDMLTGKDGMCSSNVEKCEMCEEAGKALKSKCRECMLYLCSECEKIHKKLPALKSHTLQRVAVVVRSIESELKKSLLELEKTKGGAIQKKSAIATECGRLDKTVNEALKKINKSRARQHKDVDTHHDELIRKVQEEKTSLHHKLMGENGNLDSILKDIQCLITQMNDLLKKKDKNKLLSTGELLNSQALGGIQTIQTNIDTLLQQKAEFSVEVVAFKPVNDKTSTSLNIISSITNTSTLPTSQPVVQQDSASIAMADDNENHDSQLVMSAKLEYERQLKVVDVIGNGRRLHVFGHTLWCTCWDALHVHDLVDGALIRSVYWETDEWASAVIPEDALGTMETDNMLVAYYHVGLQLLNSEGRQLDILCEGEFSDVTRFSDRVYALEWNDRRVHIFEYIQERWRQVGMVQLRYENEHSCDKLCISEENIYVSSWDKNCFHVFSFEGDLLESHGISNENDSDPVSGMVDSPKLCAIDDEGSTLVADTKNNRMQWCSASGVWEVVSFPSQIGEPEDATVNASDDSVWVLTYNSGYKMLKFK